MGLALFIDTTIGGFVLGLADLITCQGSRGQSYIVKDSVPRSTSELFSIGCVRQ